MNIPPLITLLRYKQAMRFAFTCNASRVTETATHFLHQIDLSQALNNTTFKSTIINRSNLSIRDINGNIMPSKIILDLTNNLLFVYFDGPKSVSSNTIFYLYSSNVSNEVDSTAAFTNCGITNFWGFDETIGSIAYDYANSININLYGFLSNQIGLFNKSILADSTSDYGASVSNLNYTNTTSMVMFLNLKRNSIGQEKTTVRYGNWSNTYLLLQFNSSSTAFVYSNGAKFTSTSILGADSAYHTYACIFNGNLSNEQRLKLYYDGQLQPGSTSGTIPTSFPTTEYPVYIGHDADWGQIGNYDNIFFMNSCTEGFITDRHRVLFEPYTFYTILGF